MGTDIARYPFQQIDLPLNERVQDLISRLTLDEKVSLMPQYQAAIERLGVVPTSMVRKRRTGFLGLEKRLLFLSRADWLVLGIQSC